MVKQASQTISDHINPLSILMGFLLSYIVTIPCFIVFTLILANTDFPERFITPAVIVTTIISILVASSTITGKMKSKGWLNGGTVGFLYMLVLYIISSLVFNDFNIDRYVVTMMVIGVLTGAIGGIIGINLNRSSRSKFKK